MLSIPVVCDAYTNLQQSVPNPLALPSADMYKLDHFFWDKFCYKVYCNQRQCDLLSSYCLYRDRIAQMNHFPKYRPSNILSPIPVPERPTSNAFFHTCDMLYASSQIDLEDQSVATFLDVGRCSHAPSFTE